MRYTISYEAKPHYQDEQILGDGIIEYAKLKKGHEPIMPFAYFIRDEDSNIRGGCKGSIFYGCVYVELLWIEEMLRGKDYGTQLMQAAEKLGRESGCNFAAVNTMDWEALGFYQKLGYHVEFERHGFFKTSVFYFLRKDFNAIKTT